MAKLKTKRVHARDPRFPGHSVCGVAVRGELNNTTDPAHVTCQTCQVYVQRHPERFGAAPATCRKCGCTDDDCSGCIERTGTPCCWVEADLCSACVEAA